MNLRKQQSKFARMVALLILFAYEQGYEVTLGDAARMDNRGHKKGSFHYKRLAIDLNLFNKHGKYLDDTDDHRELGAFWEYMGGTWGGRFKHPDGNHYSLGE